MATIHINDELLSVAKKYREVFLLAKAEAQAEFGQLPEEDDPFFCMELFLYQLAEAVIQTEKVEG